jgi:hypothetical protein
MQDFSKPWIPMDTSTLLQSQISNCAHASNTDLVTEVRFLDRRLSDRVPVTGISNDKCDTYPLHSKASIVSHSPFSSNSYQNQPLGMDSGESLRKSMQKSSQIKNLEEQSRGRHPSVVQDSEDAYSVSFHHHHYHHCNPQIQPVDSPRTSPSGIPPTHSDTTIDATCSYEASRSMCPSTRRSYRQQTAELIGGLDRLLFYGKTLSIAGARGVAARRPTRDQPTKPRARNVVLRDTVDIIWRVLVDEQVSVPWRACK